MSNIDERVVELRFNNQQFEQGVRKSMNTLDKLKESLNMAKSEQSMKQLEETANRMSFDKLASNVDVIANRFSTLGIIGTTALQNITNSAIAAGKQLVNAFAFEPVKSGFQEYETQINAVQTILANTSSKGTTLDQVNEALDELNHYADKTIYNFTEMTRNIGTFTAAGVDLETSVSAIKGIANLAAVSGSTSQQASTAMYQLSQALAAGTVKLMDWNSVVNAGMGGQVFQDALKDTARVHGIAIDEMIAKEGSFRETLSQGWLSAEILTETLAKFTGDLSEEQLRSIGYSEQQIASIMEMGKTANDAATKVKTFTQLIDTLKEAAQSGWTQTWELVVGDFEEAKEFLTFLSNLFGNLINKSSDARNNLLEGALSARIVDLQSWLDFSNDGITGNELFQESLKETAREYGIAVDEMINNSGSFSESLKDNWLTLDILTETLEKFDEESLKSAGYTEEQISELSALAKQAEETGTPLNKLITDIQVKPTGRELIIESIRNSLESVARVMVVVKSAWREVFPATTSEQLYKVLVGIESFTKSLVMSSEEMSKLKVSLQGIFSILDVITSIVSGTLKAGMSVLSTLLGGVNFDILDITAAAGSAAIAFHDWFEANDVFNSGLNAVITGLQTVIRWAKEFIEEIGNIPAVSVNIEKLKSTATSAFSDISNFISGATQIVKEFAAGIQALDSDASFEDFRKLVEKFVTDMITHFSGIKTNFESVENVIKQFRATTDSVLTGAGEKFDWLKEKVSAFVNFIKSHLSNVSLGAILTVGLGAGLFSTALALNKAASSIGNAVESVTSVFKSLQKYLKAKSFDTLTDGILNIAKSIAILAGSLAVLSSMDQDKLKSSAEILGVLAAALTGLIIALGLLSKFNVIGGISSFISGTSMLAESASILILVAALKKLEELDMNGIEDRLGVLLVLMTSLGAVATAMGMAATKTSIGTSVSLVAFAGSLILVVKALQDLENVNMDGIKDRLALLLILLGSLGLVGVATSGLSLGSAVSILAIVTALNTLVKVFQNIGLLDMDAAKANIEAFVTVFGVLGGLMLSTSLAGRNSGKVGVSVLAMSAALLIIVQVIKQLSEFDDPSSMDRAMETITKLFGIFSLVTISTKFAGSNALKAGAAILLMSGAIAILSGIIYVLSQLDPSGVERGTNAILALEAGFALIIGMTHFAESANGTLLIISGAMVVLGTLVAVMSMIPADNLQNATIAITSVTAVFALLIASSHFAGTATVSVITMVGALAAISMMLMALSELDNAESTLTIAESLSVVMLSLSACMGIISLIPVTGAVTGVANLAIAVIAMTAILAALGGLSQIEGFDWLIKSGSSVLADIGYAIGDFIGSIVGGFSAGATSGLPEMAANISGFFENIQIDTGAVESVARLAEAMLLVTASNVIDGITKFITGSSAYEKFGESLADFGRALKVYGVVVDGVNTEAINNSIEPAKGLTEVMDAIPNTGGLAAKLLGDNTWSDFSEGLVEYGNALKQYGEAVEGLNTESISDSIEPTKALAKVAEALPNTGGLAAKLLGDNTWLDFSEGLVEYGRALKRYGETVDGLNATSISDSIEPTRSLSEVADALPNTGGLAAKLFGDNTWSDFGAGLVEYGRALKNYGEAVLGLQITAIAQSVGASSSLAEVATSIGEIKTLSNMTTFGKVIEEFGVSFSLYSQRVSNLDFATLQNVITYFNDLANTSESLSELGDTLSLIGADTVVQFLESFESAGDEATDSVTRLADTVAGAMLLELQIHVNQFQETGTFLIDGFVKGIDGSLPKVIKAADLIGTTATNATRTAVNSNSPSKEYEDIGHDVDSGFVTGIEKDLSDVDAAGRLIGETALEATRDALDSHSDSKEMIKIAGDVSSGIVSGLKSGAEWVEDAAQENLAEPIVNGIKSAFVSDEFNDLDNYYIKEWANGMESESTSSSVKSATNNAGENLITNVADGISNCKAGEQAAKASAESIVNAFTDALSELDAKKEISDMEYSLWEALYGETSSASTKASYSVGNMISNINYQVEKVKLAKQKYEALVKELGATSDDARSAYKEYMQAQLDLQDAMTGGNTASDLLLEQAEAEYNLWYAKYGEASSESRIAQAKAQLVAKQVAAQNITIENLDAEYQQLVGTLGESNYLTIQAYIDLLNAKTELYDLYGEINQKATEPGQIIDVSEFDTWVEEFMQEIRQITSGIEIPDDIGETMTEGLTSSVSTALSDAQTSTLANAVQPVGSEMVSAINGYQTDFYTAGVNLVDGFANGIRDHKSAAIEAAIEMAKETLEGVEIELEIGSPSKAFDRIGMYSDEGLAGGFKKFAYLVENSASDVADDAFMSVSGILANLSSLIDEGLDSTPTIRPVLDLSSITNDASTIDDLFAQYSTLAMTTNRSSALSQNIAALNAMAGIQNGYKDNGSRDIVNAISDLNSRMETMNNSISRLQIVMDTGALVGQLEDPLDQRMAQRATKAARGR